MNTNSLVFTVNDSVMSGIDPWVLVAVYGTCANNG